MKALVKRYPDWGIWMEDVPMPEVGVNDVLIKVKKAAICGTDLHMYKWDDWAQAHCTPPYTMGHEFVGEVAEVGPGVRNFKVGERVTAEGHIVWDTAVTAAVVWDTSAKIPSRSALWARTVALPNMSLFPSLT